MPGDLLAVLARPCLPLSHRTFIETERRHDGLERTPVAKQSQHHSPHVCCRAQPAEGRPRRGRKGPPTGTTAVPLLLPTMDTDITQPTLSPVGTVRGVTELIVWVHWWPPLDAIQSYILRIYLGPTPFQSLSSPIFAGRISTYFKGLGTDQANSTPSAI